MNPESSVPEPDPLRVSPQPSPAEQSSGNPSGPGGDRSSSDADGGERRGQAYTAPPDFNQQQAVPEPKPKPKSWMLPVVVALILAVGLGSVAVMEQSGGSNMPPIVATQGHGVLTVTGADVDQAATDRAMAQLQTGTPDPQLAALPQDVKQDILDGQRKFYRLPPQAGNGKFQQGDKISVAFDGNPYGTYDLGQQPITLNMPLKIGDSIDIKCISVAQGKSSLVVDLATVLNPVRTYPLSPGQTEPLTIQEGTGGTNYDWFEREAASGNAVAQYGLGHMYQYGLGVAQDRAQAMNWYQKAAAQNYLDARAQLELLSAAP